MTDPADISQFLRAWTRLDRVHRKISACTEANLKNAALPPLVWHDVLLELLQAENRQLRPRDLGLQLQISQYNLSRLLDRMVKAGVLHKQNCSEDGRGFWIKLDVNGERLQKAMWIVYVQALTSQMQQHLDAESAKKLAKQLGKMLPQ